MNENRTYFQNVSIELEDLLKQYKNEYPRNIGAMVRSSFPMFLILLAIFFFAYCLVNMSMTTVIIGGLISPVLLVFGIKLKKKGASENKNNSLLRNNIKEAKAKIENYREYPDVKKYLEQFDLQIAETDRAKKHIRRNFKLLVVAVIAVALAAFMYSLFNDSLFVKGNIRNESAGDYCMILNIDETTPFLSLKQLDSNKSGDVDVQITTADFYIKGISSTSLLLSEMKVSGVSSEDLLRLVITDTDGVPVARCPKFLFSASNTNAINSEVFCPDPKNGESYKFETLNTLKFMHDNKANLRFVVEKVY